MGGAQLRDLMPARLQLTLSPEHIAAGITHGNLVNPTRILTGAKTGLIFHDRAYGRAHVVVGAPIDFEAYHSSPPPLFLTTVGPSYVTIDASDKGFGSSRQVNFLGVRRGRLDNDGSAPARISISAPGAKNLTDVFLQQTVGGISLIVGGETLTGHLLSPADMGLYLSKSNCFLLNAEPNLEHAYELSDGNYFAIIKEPAEGTVPRYFYGKPGEMTEITADGGGEIFNTASGKIEFRNGFDNPTITGSVTIKGIDDKDLTDLANPLEAEGEKSLRDHLKDSTGIKDPVEFIQTNCSQFNPEIQNKILERIYMFATDGKFKSDPFGSVREWSAQRESTDGAFAEVDSALAFFEQAFMGHASP